MDETEQTELVLAHHRREGVELETPETHARIHVVVENQVAAGDELPARRVLVRLQQEGLDRHEAVHAIGSVLSEVLFEALSSPEVRVDLSSKYWVAVERLRAEEWRRSFEQGAG